MMHFLQQTYIQEGKVGGVLSNEPVESLPEQDIGYSSSLIIPVV